MSGFKPPTGLPTVFDPSYKGVGQKVGLDIWRIEALKVVKKSPDDKAYQGQLHTGDSYIVLSTKAKENALVHDIHFWLGTETSQDEMGVAAYKTVELDQSMGDEPVQRREVQGHESDEFLALFKGGLRYLEGGVATGFKHVDRDAFTTRLLHVKGRRNIRVAQVELSPASMNSGDVFILDAGRNIFQWNGKDSTNVEKVKALEVTRKIRDEERSGNATITVLEEGKGGDQDFWQKMGCPKPTKIKTAADTGDDDNYNVSANAKVALYKISDASGKIVSSEIKVSPLKKELLDTNECFILDTASSGIFVWVGRKSSNDEKLHSMRMATDFIKSKGYPNWTPVVRVVEDGETPLFKQNFNQWKERDATGLGGIGPAGKKKVFLKKDFNAASLQTKGTREAQTLVDDGKGKIEIWRIENFEMQPVPKEQYGHFFGGDSYVILYTYLKNDKELHIIYFWQGLKSSQDERGASALWAKNLDDKYGGEPVQVRIVENKEPDHFYLIFKGKMVVHSGGHASGFKNRQDKDSYDTDGTRLFQVRATNANNVRAIQVAERGASLTSGDSFILESPKKSWIWAGKGSTGDEREFAKTISKAIASKEFDIIGEGAEPEAFWTALGGKEPYAAVKTGNEVAITKEPRLFQCTNAVGYFRVEEIFDYDQEDLIEDDVMILDTYQEVFVWIGKGANTEEKKKSLETAVEYIKADKSGRTVNDTVLATIKQGFEPLNFTCHFFAWDAEKWSNGKTYEQIKAELTAAGKGTEVLQTSVQESLASLSKGEYSYAQLTSKSVPEGVDPTKKEQYLSEAEFKTVFGISKTEYNALPAWKAKPLKQKANLY